MNAVRGTILNPRPGGTVDLIAGGLLGWDDAGRITYVGPTTAGRPRRRAGMILPPLLDCHTHVPQWPIRGHFCDGVGHAEGGRLLAGLNRNVFPTEARCADAEHTAAVVEQFRRGHAQPGRGRRGGLHDGSCRRDGAALAGLGDLWHVGLVLMNQNCPDYLRTDEPNLERDVDRLAERFGRRLIVTDRFAVAVDSPLRRRAVALARRHGLRMQTHLNEQPAEKDFVERVLYPGHSYTGVYRDDGLLGRSPILAHCVHMRPDEWDLVAASGSVVAHCPTSNALLGSGIMPLDDVIDRGVPYAICTDVGASPTTSLLAEMAVFLRVHAGRSRRATPSEALYRTTLGAAELLGVADRVGTFAVGRPASFIEVPGAGSPAADADRVIVEQLLGVGPPDAATASAVAALAAGGVEDVATLALLEADVRAAAGRSDGRVSRVTLDGRTAWTRA